MYEQTFEIEHRLTDLLTLVGQGGFSTPRLADRLGVSIPTVSRGIRALRSRGHRIRASRLSDGKWCYRIEQAASDFPLKRRQSNTQDAQLRVGT